MGDEAPRLELRGITKAYGALLANDGVDLSVAPGSIHAVLGENGAGKSTLMKVVYGSVRADAGTIAWEGRTVALASPAQARALGIAMVFQHFSLFPALTVFENLALALPGHRDRRALAARAVELADRHGLSLDPSRGIHSLSVGERQRVEIVRCLLQEPRLLIMDEPTSVLTPQAVDELFGLLRRLAAQGCSVLYISHKLDEVRALCDAATVLRQGRVVARPDPRTAGTRELAEAMIGALPPRVTRAPVPGAHPVRLAVSGLGRSATAGVSLRDASFEVRAGEILGVAGIAGNGQAELLDALSGEVTGITGSIAIDGRDVTRSGAAERRAMGLVYIPEERLGRGAVPRMSLARNGLLTTARLGLVRKGFVEERKVDAFARDVIARYRVSCRGPQDEARTLSGGNLQRFIVGRELSQSPGIVIAAQPTWGLDVGAAESIRALLVELRSAGAAVLVISEDLDELFEICDRLTVIAGGRLSPAVRVEDTTVEEIGRWMGAVRDAAHA